MFLLSSTAFADENTDLIKVTPLWKTFRITEAAEITAIVKGPRGSYLAAGSIYEEAKGLENWVGELSVDGKKIWETKNWQDPGRGGDLKSLALSTDGCVWVASSSLVSKFTSKGKHLFSRGLFELASYDYYEVTAVADALNGGLVLVGKCSDGRGKSSDAWALAISADGEKLWEHRYDRGQDEWIMSALRTPDGQYLFAAISGRYDKFGAGFSNVWIFQCDPHGRNLKEHFGKGRMMAGAKPALAYQAGKVFFGHGNSAFPQGDAWITCLRSDLTKAWTKQIAPPEITIDTPAVAAMDDGTLVVTWEGEDSLLLVRINDRGDVLLRRSFPDARDFFVPEHGATGRLFVQKMDDGA